MIKDRNGRCKSNITLFSQAAKADTSLHMQAFSRVHFVGPELFTKVFSRSIGGPDPPPPPPPGKIGPPLNPVPTARKTALITFFESSTNLYAFPRIQRGGGVPFFQGGGGVQMFIYL